MQSKRINQDDISIALVWTKYQYHILLALLRELGIDRSSVLIIVFAKAQRHGVNGDGFFETVFYDTEEYASVKDWSRVKKEIYKLIKSFDFYPRNFLLRSYDSAIGRVLFSQYPKASVYLFEDGTASYKKRNYLGYPNGVKETLRNIFLRFYFSTGSLKVLPVPQKNVIKSGLFVSVDPWLKVPCIPVKLSKEDIFGVDGVSDYRLKINKVLILEQPLWQVGLDDHMVMHAYYEMAMYIAQQYELSKDIVTMKMHPSSDKNRVKELLKSVHLEDKIEILDTKKNLEEMTFSGELSSVQMIIGFYSSGLYVAKALLDKRNVDVVAFSTQKLEKNFYEIYEMFKEVGITHGREIVHK